MVDEIVKRRFVLICSIRSVSIVWTTWIKVAYLLFYVHKIQKKSKKRRKNIVKRKIHSIRKHQRKTKNKKRKCFSGNIFCEKNTLKVWHPHEIIHSEKKVKKATSFSILFDFFLWKSFVWEFWNYKQRIISICMKIHVFFYNFPQID